MFSTERLSIAMIFIVTAVGCTSVPKMGPYDIDIKYMEHCGNNTDYIEVDWKFQRINRSLIIANTTLNLKIAIDDRIKVETKLAVMTNQGWKDNYMTTNFNNMGACELARRTLTPKQYAQIASNMIPPVKGCPLAPGIYREEVVIQMQAYNLAPIFVYNKYRARTGLFRDEVEIFCHYIYADVVPKRVRRKN